MIVRLAVAVFALALAASCGGENNGVPPSKNNASNNGGTNNGTPGTNNGTAGTNNATVGTNNATVGTNNATTGTNNATVGTNNAMTGTNNATTGTNNGTTNGCTELDPAIGSCDPICQTGCGAGEHCVTTNTDPLATECVADGGGTQGSACQDDTGCASGYQCRSVGGGSLRCLAYCSPAANDCPTNHTCTAYVGEPRLGVCISS